MTLSSCCHCYEPKLASPIFWWPRKQLPRNSYIGNNLRQFEFFQKIEEACTPTFNWRLFRIILFKNKQPNQRKGTLSGVDVPPEDIDTLQNQVKCISLCKLLLMNKKMWMKTWAPHLIGRKSLVILASVSG